MSITNREPRVEAKPSDQQREPRQLFGTLIASRPARNRSPLAIATAVSIHLVVLTLLVIFSRPFIPALAHKLFEQVTIIIPEEEQPTVVLGPARGGAPEAPRKRDEERPRRTPEVSDAAPLRFTPGPITEIAPAAPGPETVEPTGEGRGGNGAPSSLADRLRSPAVYDPRLRSGTSFALPGDAGSPTAIVRDRVAQALSTYNDSIAAEREARERGLDWTKTTKDGKRWGVGPDGKIYLGDVVLPPLVAFAAPPGKRDEIRNRNRDWAEIEAQVGREIGRQTFKDRVKAIRARKEAERSEKKKEDAGTPITN